MPKFNTIVIDPPWPSGDLGHFKSRKQHVTPYPKMTMEEIRNLPIQRLAGKNCHLWLWTINSFLHEAFHLIEVWDFKYLAIITAVKPSGFGAYFANTTQHLLFAYNEKCFFTKKRWRPTHFMFRPEKHSKKPEEGYKLIESISIGPKLELFAREKRDGWTVIGNEINGLNIKDALESL